MKREYIETSVSLLAILLCAAGCTPRGVRVPGPGASIKRVTAVQSGQLIRLQENWFLAVHLPRYDDGRWFLARKPATAVLRAVGSRFSQKAAMPESAGGEDIFYFEANGPGITSLQLAEKSADGLRGGEFEITVYVYY